MRSIGNGRWSQAPSAPEARAFQVTQFAQRALCVVVVAVSAAALVGWWYDVELLKTTLPGRTTMKANTAVGLLAAGLSICVQPCCPTKWGSRMAGAAATGGLLVAALGVATLLEYILGLSFGIDEALFADPLTTSAPFNGRMSPVTAAVLTGLGMATTLLARRSKRSVAFAHWLALPPAAVGMLCLTGYAYGVERLYSLGPYVAVAFNTSTCLCALAAAVLLTRSAEGCARSLVGRPASRVIVASLLPLALLIPFLTGLLVLTGVRMGLYEALFGLALFAAVIAGVFVWVSWVTTDVAVRIETALVASEGRFRQVAETMPNIVFVTDSQGRCDYANATFQKFSGLAVDELAGDGWLASLHPDDASKAALTWRAAVETGEPFETQLRFRRHDGAFVCHIGRSLPLRDEKGAITGWFGACTDIQDMMDAREALSRTNEGLEATVAARTAELAQLQKLDAIGQLTGGVAHDFNNLLTPIMGSLELLQRRLSAEDERTQHSIEVALQATSRAATLVQRLLAFARRQDLQPRVVDVGRVLTDLEELVQRSLGSAVQVRLEVEPDLPAATVDPHQLELAILNLAINGRDAMPDGGLLHIEVAACKAFEIPGELTLGDYVCISVSDTGTGMDAETLRRAVEPFFSTKELGKGTGLGLSMAHGLAAQSGGTLVLHSMVGVGTSVRMWLPSTPETPAQAEVRNLATPLQSPSRTILLVDDEELVRSVTAEMLTDAGFTVVSAGSGAEAMRRLRDTSAEVDLLVSDFLMPGMNGAELAGHAQRLRPGLPILLVTGYSNLADGPGACLPKLTKPFREADLLTQVHRLLEQGQEGSNVVPLRGRLMSWQTAEAG